MNQNDFEQFKTRMAFTCILITLISAFCGGVIGYFTAIQTVICK